MLETVSRRRVDVELRLVKAMDSSGTLYTVVITVFGYLSVSKNQDSTMKLLRFLIVEAEKGFTKSAFATSLNHQ